MAKAKDKGGQKGAPVQGDFATFSGFEDQCASGKNKKSKGK